MPYHVQRNGKPIGQHDEQTLRVLLNAGMLRLTDTYRGQGMAQAEPLASLLGDGRPWRTWPGWLFVGAIAAVAVLGFALPGAVKPHTPRMTEAGGQRTAGVEEIHRGFPVIRGGLTLSSHSEGAALPQPGVEEGCAQRSRVAVLALDANDAPIAFGAGFITGDGSQVVTTLKAVSGASAVELRFANGRSARATNVIVDDPTGLAVLGAGQAGTPLAWADATPLMGEEVFIAGHGLLPSPAPVLVQLALPEEKHVFYKVDSDLEPSTAGSAVLNAAGEACAIVIKPDSGLILRGADIRPLLQGQPQGIEALARLPVHAARQALVVDSAEIEDGRLILQLRNTGGTSISQALLHIRYHELPREAGEAMDLERELATIAVEASTLEFDEPGSERYFRARQQLREVTARLEAARRSSATALLAARQRVYRTDVLSIEAALPPGLPQRVAIESEAGSNWGAMVSVLDVRFD